MLERLEVVLDTLLGLINPSRCNTGQSDVLKEVVVLLSHQLIVLLD